MGANQIQPVTDWALTIKFVGEGDVQGLFSNKNRDKICRMSNFCHEHLGPPGDRWQVFSMEPDCLVFQIRDSEDAVWMQLLV